MEKICPSSKQEVPCVKVVKTIAFTYNRSGFYGIYNIYTVKRIVDGKWVCMATFRDTNKDLKKVAISYAKGLEKMLTVGEEVVYISKGYGE